MDNGTFIVRKRKPSDRPIGSRWVFLVKRKADGSIDRYKGRVVAQGFSQRPGFDFTETWAPTAKMASIRAILATAGFEDWDIEQVLRYYWLRHTVAAGVLSLHYLPTAEMPADCLTKAFTKDKMAIARKQLGLCL